ncbi:MAG TPA: META domain-containing protein [Candidatus Limnocylindrales bacterium]|nr:META domain-containing protein [Candidatus Limnocylindrales bacterium]
MRMLTTGLALVAIAATVAACGIIGGSGGTGGTIEGPAWKLTSVTTDGTSTPVPDGVFVDARFRDGMVSGSSGCNAYTGEATISGATIKVGPLAGTRIACEPPASDIETAYLAALESAATFTATADELTIFDGSGSAVLAYEAGPDNALIGNWVVTGYNNGAEAVVGPVEGSTPTVAFTADGVVGDSGCNSFNGGYTLDGETVTIGPLATTMKACEQPLMDQETQLLTALQTPATVEASGGMVTLRDANGAIQVTLAPKG